MRPEAAQAGPFLVARLGSLLVARDTLSPATSMDHLCRAFSPRAWDHLVASYGTGGDCGVFGAPERAQCASDIAVEPSEGP